MWIQAWDFLLTAVIGIVVACIFHFHQCNVKQFPIQGIWLFVFDLCVWLLVIPLVFAGLLLINQGEVRFHTFLALVLGGVLYMTYLRPRLNRPVELASLYTVKTIRAVLSVLAIPWRFFKSSPPPGDGE